MPIIAKIVSDKLSAPEAERLIESYISNSLPKQKRERAKKKKPAVFGKLGDIKMLFNTLDKAVTLLKAAGYTASWQKTELENALEIKLVVRK